MTITAPKVVIPDKVTIKRALLSVSDKSGIVELAKTLQAHNVALISTGGTATLLKKEGLEVADVSALTNFPEIMDGRVKTLHPGVHGGLLGIRSHKDHQQAMDRHGIEPIDLLVVNLYPFEQTLAAGADHQTIIENIDIGGPAMIRAAAKNHNFVTVLTEPGDVAGLLEQLKNNDGATTLKFRKKMAAKAFARTASYDSAIAAWFAKTADEELTEEKSGDLPQHISFSGELVQTLRYGENPHQRAGFYKTSETRLGVATAKQIQGKQLSYNNINDTNAAFELVSEFDEKTPAVAIIKHANPCGVATGSDFCQAYECALSCDPVSAFGGIVALNGELDEKTAEKIITLFTEVIIAPSASEKAMALIGQKPNIRLLLTGGLAEPDQTGFEVKSIAGGLLIQSRDDGSVKINDLKVVTKKKPTKKQLSDLLFAFRVAKHVKSNAIIYAKGGATIGIGAGQMSRIDSARIAAQKAEDAALAQGLAPAEYLKDCVVASDAFFPFADGLVSAIKAGAKAVIQPGGSMRDDEVIKAADEAGIAMVFTGMRHFRH